MAKSLFITSMEAQSGKTPVALGFMEQLSGRLKSVSVFRPVISEGSGPDRLIALMTISITFGSRRRPVRGHLRCGANAPQAPANAMSCTAASSEKYKALESRCDLSSA